MAGGLAFLVITQALSLCVPRLLHLAADAVKDRREADVRHAAYLLVAAAVGACVARILSRLLIFNAGRSVEYDMRNDLFAHLVRLAPSFYQKLPAGQLMSRMVNDLTQVRLMLGPGLLNITNTSLVYLVVVPLLFLTDPVLAFFSLLGFPLLIVLARLFGRRLFEQSADAQEKLGTLSAKVQENLSGAMTVRAYRREAAEEAAFGALNDRYLDVNMRLARLRGLMFPLMGLTGSIAAIVILFLGGEKIAEGKMTVGAFVEFNAYLAALAWPTIALGWMISLWQRGLASMKRINDIFTAQPTLVDGPRTPLPLRAALEIRKLTYSYPGARQPALQDVTARFEPGETVVIVGRTGCGKTTLLKALARLLEVPRGSIFLDEIDVDDLPLAHVRGALAFAPQDAFLFSRTIFENVAFGRPDASDAEVREAIAAANLAADVAGFPDRLDTLVGERGITLSGGQRQRTTLARALLVDPPILLLDDALAAVDTETESRILGALQERGRSGSGGPGGEPRTTIVTTHRLAFAARADRILVMEKGRVVEQGTEGELLALDGQYAAMHRRQRLRQEIAERTGESGGEPPASTPEARP